MLVSVFRTGDQSALDIAAAVNGYVERARARLPQGISMTLWQDQARVLDDRLTLMLRNGATGFLLVFVVLTLFLELRLAFWVSLGIPISFLGAIALMPGLDVSVNVISLFAFILVLGIVVDDAIIVGENIYRHQEEHGEGLRGAIEGAREIGKPVTFAVLTTVAAFMPLMFVPGMMGKIFRVIPLIVIPCLLFLPRRVARHPARAPVAYPQARQARSVATLPEPLLQRPEAFHPPGLHADPGDCAALALRDGGDRPVDPDPDRRHGARRLGQLPFLPVHRGRLHVGVGDDAAGHARRRHVAGHRQARGGRHASPYAVAAGNRDGLLPARNRRPSATSRWRRAAADRWARSKSCRPATWGR